MNGALSCHNARDWPARGRPLDEIAAMVRVATPPGSMVAAVTFVLEARPDADLVEVPGAGHWAA